MGYTTYFTGEITITPPIPWGRLTGSPFLPDNARNYGGRDSDGPRDLMFRIEEQTTETDEGILTRRSAAALVTTWEDEMKGYDIVEHLQEVIDAFPDHEFTGRLDCAGEESPDIWRLEIHDRRAVKVRPRIVWPDGEEHRFGD